MIKLKKFKERIDNSTSRAFIGYDENEVPWVIRPKLKGSSSQRLFNEYFSGKIGEELSISRPPVELIKLDADISHYFEEKIDYDSLGVATKYYDDITSIISPPNSNCLNDDFPEVNARYLQKVFRNNYDYEEFYSYRIYAAWIYLEDYLKYEILHINKKSLRPIFIDFDLSFKGVGWSELPRDYSCEGMKSCAYFLDGIIKDIKRFEKYYKIIRTIDKNKYFEIITTLPECWNIPQFFKDNVMNLLFEQRELFIREFSYLYVDINK
jgi:hypothetical protein